MKEVLSDDVNIVRGGDDDVPEDKENWIIFDIGGGELDHHTEECKKVNEVALFPAIPVSAAFEIGHHYMHKVYPTINIYDECDGFFKTISIGG